MPEGQQICVTAAMAQIIEDTVERSSVWSLSSQRQCHWLLQLRLL